VANFHEKPNHFIKEITIKVLDLERSIQFYTDFIGLSILEKNKTSVVLTADGKIPLLRIIQPAEVTPKQKRTTGLYHFAILLPSREALSSFLNHLISVRYPFGSADHIVSEAIYIDDPDGNGIEIYYDRYADDWKWHVDQVEMATLPLKMDELIGVSQKKWTKVPKETMMGHIHLHVKDLDETVKFYTEGLGYNIVAEYPGAVFLSTGGYHHHIGMSIWNGAGAVKPSDNSVGMDNYVIDFADDNARNEAIQRLQKLSAETTVVKVEDNYVVYDPSGNKIILQI